MALARSFIKPERQLQAPPSQEPRDHRVQAARATFSQIHGHDPKASDDEVMWQMEVEQETSETWRENGSEVRRKRNYRRSGATQSPLTCALSIISVDEGASALEGNPRE